MDCWRRCAARPDAQENPRDERASRMGSRVDHSAQPGTIYLARFADSEVDLWRPAAFVEGIGYSADR